MLLSPSLMRSLKNNVNTNRLFKHLYHLNDKHFKTLLNDVLSKINVPELAQEILNDALEIASDYGHLEKVKHLIELGANTITEAISAAAMEGRLNVLEFLVTQEHLKTDLPVIWAANGGHKDVIDFLVLHGFHIAEGCDIYALANGHKELSRHIKELKKNAQVTANCTFLNAASSDDLNSVSNHGV